MLVSTMLSWRNIKPPTLMSILETCYGSTTWGFELDSASISGVKLYDKLTVVWMLVQSSKTKLHWMVPMRVYAL
jgi:hypothetical protein